MKYLGNLCLIILASIVLSGCNRLDNHQPLGSSNLSFIKGNEISQTFISHHNALNVISICLRNSTHSLIPLRFELKDSAGSVIRSLDLSGGNIDNEDCTRFQFAPLSSSKNQSYSAIIRTNFSPPLASAEETLMRQGVGIEAHGGGDYLGGQASVDGVLTPYDLHFKTFYKQDLNNVIQESLSKLLVRFTQDPIFLIVFILLVGGIILKLRKTK